MSLKSLRIVVVIAIVLALFVVILGAYTRLTGAGLGCPDWPGCYGHMVLPTAKNELSTAQNQYPNLPIETRKAWTEMAHRYAAGSLAFLIFVIGCSVLRLRQRGTLLPWRLPFALMILVVFQAALGMWTVTLKLLPIVVMGHLLGGVFIFSFLCYFFAQLNGAVLTFLPHWRKWIRFGVFLVVCQIALGGWVSSNYAGVACIGFPQCNGQWLPELHLHQGFNLFSPVGANYQGGVLDNDVRVTIQLIHRLGALIVTSYVLILSALLFMRKGNNIQPGQKNDLRTVAMLALILVFIQFALGVANVVFLLPLWVAVMHNGVAAILLATMFLMHYLSTGGAANVRRY